MERGSYARGIPHAGEPRSPAQSPLSVTFLLIVM
jgi:hypothetical protein